MVRSALMLICLLSVSVRAEQTSFDQLRKEVIEEFEKHPKHLYVDRVARSADLDAQGSRFQSPWSIRADAYTAAYESDKAAARTVPASVDLAFVNRNGTEVHFGNGFFQRQVTNYNHIVPYQGTFWIGHDVTTGGARSAANLEADLIKYNATASYLGSETQLRTDSQMLHTLLVQYYNAMCRLGDFQDLSARVEVVVSAAKLKLETKTLSTREFLILKSSSNVIARQIENLGLRVDDIEVQLLNYGANILNAARRARKGGMICTDAADLDLPKLSATETASLEGVKSLSQVMYNEVQRESQQKKLDILKIHTRASLLPYVGLQEYNDQPRGYSRHEGIIGVRFTFQFNGPNRQLEIGAAAERLKAYTILSRQSQIDAFRDISVMQRSLERSRGYLTVIKTSLATSRELLRVIKLQLDLGLIDPILAGQAFTNYGNELREARDNWEMAMIAWAQLKEVDASRARIATSMKNSMRY